MMITTILGNIYHDAKWQSPARTVDYVDLEWHELNKRLLRKKSRSQQEVGIQLSSNQALLSEGDVLFSDATTLLVINVLPCECIAVETHDQHEMASICYEIGNRHAPLFFHPTKENILLLAMDKPLMLMLEKMGCHVHVANAKLIYPLGGAAKRHAHTHSHDE